MMNYRHPNDNLMLVLLIAKLMLIQANLWRTELSNEIKFNLSGVYATNPDPNPNPRESAWNCS